MSDVPTVTVLIPARNEEADIERCLRAVLAQDHPHDRMEIVLVDGGSFDRTAEVASRVLSEGDITWKIIENAVGTTPSNLNTGLAVATGRYLCRVDARSIIPPEYVRHCVDVLASRSHVAVTGGAQVAVGGGSATAIGIARALNNRYSTGGARYRVGGRSGPCDTVYLGAFRTADLRLAGGWNEALATNQDFDLNRRLGAGGMVWFDSRLTVGYVPRATFRDLGAQYHRFGRWKVRYWRLTGDRPLPRQWAMLVGAPLAVCGLATAIATSRARTPRLLAGSFVGFALWLLAEDRGTRGPEGGLYARSVSAGAMAIVAGAWVTGVIREALGWSTHRGASGTAMPHPS